MLSWIFSIDQSFAGCDDGVSVYYYNGIPGCGCFYHCECFSHYISDKIGGGFPNDTTWHPKYPEDRVWHEFMKKFLSAKKAGPYFPADSCDIRHMVQASNACGYLCLLSEYLNAANWLGRKIEFTRVDSIEWYKKLYKNPKDHEKLISNIDRINNQANNAFQILSTIPGTIIPIYKELIESCYHHESYNMVPMYNRGLIALMEGNIDGSLSDIISFIELAKKNGKENLLTSEVFQKQGEAFLEVGLYHKAIESLNTAIAKDPKNLEAYFQRASAYFEVGNFEKSLDDYLNSKKSEHFVPYNLAPNEFVNAFSEAAFNGACDAACDFVPSLCNTVYGLGECLWAFGEHPIDSVNNLASAGYEMAEHVVDYLKTVDRDKLHEYADELVRLYENFNHLTDHEKGELVGYAVGKYGVDIFAGSAAIKGVSAYKKLKEANRICNLESMTISVSSKEAVISKGLQQYSERSKFFANSEVHWGRQNKHIPGTNNYEVSKHRSIMEHNNPTSLLKKHAGSGIPERGTPGMPGYKETIDFREHIGIWKTQDGSLQLPTTRGTIHYSKDGAHIVPARPNVIKD